jgi:uncharacterized protein YlzI (FlbEa/FlbD family)
MKADCWQVFLIFKQNSDMAKFIHIKNQQGIDYYINTDHIVFVFRHNIGQTLIKIQDGREIITELPMDEVIKRIG